METSNPATIMIYARDSHLLAPLNFLVEERFRGTEVKIGRIFFFFFVLSIDVSRIFFSSFFLHVFPTFVILVQKKKKNNNTKQPSPGQVWGTDKPSEILQASPSPSFFLAP